MESQLSNLNESLGLVRYALLWGSTALGLGSLALLAWSAQPSREGILDASRRMETWPVRYVVAGLLTYGLLGLLAVVLLKVAVVFGLVALTLIAMRIVAPAVAAAALSLGERVTGSAAEPDRGMRNLLVGLGVMSGTGFLFVIGLLPWCWWVLAATGAMHARRLGAWAAGMFTAVATKAQEASAAEAKPVPAAAPSTPEPAGSDAPAKP